MTANDKRIILAIVSLFLTSAALGRDDLTVRWGHQLVTPTDNVARAAVADSNDGIYFTVEKQTKDASGATRPRICFFSSTANRAISCGVSNLNPDLRMPGV